jgi:hypothetical protein
MDGERTRKQAAFKDAAFKDIVELDNPSRSTMTRDQPA